MRDNIRRAKRGNIIHLPVVEQFKFVVWYCLKQLDYMFEAALTSYVHEIITHEAVSPLLKLILFLLSAHT